MTPRGLPAVVVAVLAAGCGGDERGIPGAPSRPPTDPFADVERERAREAPVLRAAPRWEPLATLDGDGDVRRTLEVAPRAIQWRARWRCRDGTLRVAATGGRAARPAVLLDERCPASGTATAVSTGRIGLDVAAAGPWRLQVDQQVDTPLHEPPPREARRVAAGRFVGLERRTRGEAQLLRRSDGRLVLRLDGFVTAASDDLFVWVSPASRPGNSRAALRAPYVEIGALRATAGEQNYVLPRALGVDDVRSVVIWCEPVRIAYGAAELR